ncbi:MAG: YicC family protein [Clostridia bacterium]|nr:YicC family protein [Clostridia bacterium]
MHSMTGYGRCQIESEGRLMTVEVKSVNHRFLDVSYRLARHLMFLDDAVRKGVAARLARGHVDVFVNYENHREDAREVRVDTALAAAYQRAMNELSKTLGIESGVSLNDFARMPDVLTVQESAEDQDAVRELFQQTLSGALDALITMRAQEGESMKRDILDKISKIEGIRDAIAVRAPLVVEEYRIKLKERIAALTEGEVDEARLLTEIAIFADRAAIDEELVRLLSHTAQIRKTVELSEPVGRKLDFLVQELNREVNTIGSKAMDAEIAQYVVQAKGEIEKLREQVQNIE